MAEKITERSLSQKIVFYLAAWFGWIFILLWCSTLKIKSEGLHTLQEFRRRKQPFIIAVWHGRFFIPVFLFRFWHFMVLVSQHWDGEMIARTLQRLGYGTVRGSSTRGGNRAFHYMRKLLNAGHDCAIIPDGPKGPRQRLKSGLVYLSYQTGVPIICLTFSASSVLIFKSWDRFVVPKPFTRVLVRISTPIWLNKNADDRELELAKQRIEQFMIQQEEDADAFFAK